MALEDGLFGSLFGGGMMNPGAGLMASGGVDPSASALTAPPTPMLPQGMDIGDLLQKLREKMQGVGAPAGSPPDGAPPPVQTDAPSLPGMAPLNQEAKLLNKAPGVDPRLYDILNKATDALPEGYAARVSSGLREGDPRFHGQGKAMDVEILDPKGKALPNYQDAQSFRPYEQLAQQARQVQQSAYPDLDPAFRWGGYFSGPKGKYGALDTMHFDLGGNRVGMGGGSWQGGLTDAQRALFPGVQSAGMTSGAPSSMSAYASADSTAPPMPPPRPIQVASADPSFVPASATTQTQPQRRGMLGSLFGSLFNSPPADGGDASAPAAPAPMAATSPPSGGNSGGPLSNALGLSDNTRNLLQALALSVASSTDKRTPFANMPALMFALQNQNTQQADKAYQRQKDQRDYDLRKAETERAQQNSDRSFGFQKQQADTAQSNANRGFDFQTWRAGAPQRVTTADGSVVELPGRQFPGSGGPQTPPTQLVPPVAPVQAPSAPAPSLATGGDASASASRTIDPGSDSPGGIASPADSNMPAAVAPITAPAPTAPQLPPGARVLIPGQKTPESTDPIKNYLYDMKDRDTRGAARIPFSQWVKEDAEAKKNVQNTTINNGPNGEPLGNPEAGLVWKRTPDGKVAFDDRGAPIAIPYQGGKAYNTEQDAAATAAKGKQQKAISSDIVTQDIDRILKGVDQSPLPSTGLVGTVLSKVPGSNAHDMAKLLDTIKANVGFEQLQQMREASPTGGALGAISDFENKLLQSTKGNLEQSQSSDQFKYNLKRLKNLVLDIVHGPGHGPAREELGPAKVKTYNPQTGDFE